ncbi:MAG: hypothetical protein KF895_03200 [Parvibaculum sp.]|nr:hypothetical protein [Parvibaculum sp.]
MQKSPVQKILDANERTADLAHRNDVLRGQRDFARRLAGAGWLTALALGTALAFLLSGCAGADEGTVTYDMGGSIGAYSAKYHDWEQRGIRARIIGVCGSACTLALRNKDMCYAADAEFLFHGVSRRGEYDARASASFRDAMPEGVQRWADSTGAFSSTDIVSISGRDLAAFDGRAC